MTLLSILAASALAHAVGTRRFVLDDGNDFKGGDLEGVAIDAGGGVRAGFSLGATPIAQASTIWSALALKDGSLLLGTGNDGKLIKVVGGTSSVVAETKALAVTSLAEGWGGKVVVATLPEGKLWTFDRDKLSPLATLKGAEHVWQVAFDAKAGVAYAATGPEGKLFRITANGDAQVYFDAEEQHLMSVAVGPDGTVYAGASDKAKLYRLTGPGRSSVLYDFERTEVRRIAVSASGEVFAIANEIKPGSQIPQRQAKIPEGNAAGPAPASPPARGKGVLYRFSRDGRPDELLEDADEHYTALGLGDDGRPYVGTGAEGRVYTVDQSHNSVLIADTDERQVTALLLAGQKRFVLASDPAVVHPVKGVGGVDAVWTSKVFDAGIRARFGRIEWDGSGPLELSTRSGNTKEPDESWSAWSKPFAAPTRIESPPARYLQLRARFSKDPNAVLRELSVAFVTDNLRAVVTEVKVKGVDDASSDDSVRSSGGPVAKRTDSNLNLSWKVDNPDKDELRYRLKYRLVGSNTWYDLTKAEDRLSKETYTWDTSDLPEGRYRVQVAASDEPSNPPESVTRDQLESGVVIVDNTPPVVEGLRLVGRRLTAVVLDGVGPIARVEVSAAGSDEWRPVGAQDGIFDEQREELDVDISPILPAGPVLVSVRAYDFAGNFVVKNLPLK